MRKLQDVFMSEPLRWNKTPHEGQTDEKCNAQRISCALYQLTLLIPGKDLMLFIRSFSTKFVSVGTSEILLGNMKEGILFQVPRHSEPRTQ